jgi:hypothetical protein
MSKRSLPFEAPSNFFSVAVRSFWSTRDNQSVRGILDQGARSAVTGGQQMNGFAEALIKLLRQYGVPQSEIFSLRGKTLPGFYRPTKDWDLLVVSKGRLLAAIELKSQVGPSFGNNFNNRSEEALGTSLDLWTAFREGAFPMAPRPWLGYLFLLEDCPASRRPIRTAEPHFPVREEFRDASYAERYVLLCRKLVLERQYDSSCLLFSDRKTARKRPNYAEAGEDLGAHQFLNQLLSHVSNVDR